MPTPRFGLPFIAQGQAQKEVTHNDALVQLDALIDLYLLDRDLATPPGSPADGDTYLVAASPTGAWAGHAGEIAFSLDGGWRFYPGEKGLLAYLADEQRLLLFTGVAWTDIMSVLALQNLPMVGVNTSADATNKLAVKSNAVLLAALEAANGGNGDVQVKLSKEAVGDTASFLFQTNFSGRAEIGLTGDDSFHFKVSPDGAAFLDAIVIDPATGKVTQQYGLTGLPAPSASSDAATKGYVDGIATNLGKRQRARFKTTANVNLAGGGLAAGTVHDGVTAVAGDVALVDDQSAAAENGVYIVPAAGVASRAVEFDTYDEYPGALIAVEEGTNQHDTVWLCTSNVGGTLGTTAIDFSQTTATGALLAANNLSDLANPSAARGNLGLGSMATQAAGSVAISGGAIDGTGIGATTPAAGKFNTLQATAAVTLSPANANVALSPTGTGSVAVNPATAGTIDNMAVGGSTPAAGKFTTLGVNTTADATNKLAVKSNAVLFAALEAANGGDGDIRFVVNKEADGDTASLLFQKGFSGRAEFGLVGDNDFRLKVSPDGSTWYDSLSIDRASGRVKPTQPLLGRGRYMWWLPQGNTTTVQVWGFAENAIGTATARTVATTNLFTSVSRLGYVSAATAGASAGTRHGLLQFWRGNAAGLGGFFYVARLGIAQFQTNLRAFVGLYGTATAIGNVNPSTLLNMVGLAVDSGQTTWRIMRNDGSGTATAIDLGANFPANTSGADLYELALWCTPNSGTINYRVERLNTSFVAEGVLSSDLPLNTALLAPQIWVNNGTTAAAVAIDAANQYLEVPF